MTINDKSISEAIKNSELQKSKLKAQIYTGFSSKEIMLALSELSSDKNNIIIQFDDFNDLTNICGFSESGPAKKTILEEYLSYKLVKKLANQKLIDLNLSISYLWKWQNFFENLKEQKDLSSFVKIFDKLSVHEADCCSFRNILEEDNPFTINLYVDGFNTNPFTEDIEIIINSMLLGTKTTLRIFTEENELASYICSPGEILTDDDCHFIQKGRIVETELIGELNAEIDKAMDKKVTSEAHNQKRIDITPFSREDLERLKCVQFKNKSNPYPCLNHAELFSELPIDVLPVSSETLNCFSNFDNLKELYEQLANQKHSGFIPLTSSTAILGFDALNKSINQKERKVLLTSDLFFKQYEESKEVIDEEYYSILNFLIEYFNSTGNLHSCFLPLKTIKCGGTMSDFIDYSTFKRFLESNEERIKEILSYQYVPNTKAISSVKKLIFTPNRKRNAIKNFK